MRACVSSCLADTHLLGEPGHDGVRRGLDMRREQHRRLRLGRVVQRVDLVARVVGVAVQRARALRPVRAQRI